MQAESKSELDERSKNSRDDNRLDSEGAKIDNNKGTNRDKNIDSKNTPNFDSSDAKVSEKERDRDRLRDSKGSAPRATPQQPETLCSRRNKKWAAFARSKVCFGFKHLAADSIPSTVPDTRGIAVCLERIGGWTIPTAVQREIQRSKNEYGILLLSIYYAINRMHEFLSVSIQT